MSKKLNSLLLAGSLFLCALPLHGQQPHRSTVEGNAFPAWVASMAMEDDGKDRIPLPKTNMEFEEPEKNPDVPKAD
ncbi:MAG: hypothetical protein LBF24_02430 [Puniceicoccales bacterium]|jgi:hypothetical protein|nr:hypothetical protein [Puniceicoccales bacterium]